MFYSAGNRLERLARDKHSSFFVGAKEIKFYDVDTTRVNVIKLFRL
jgi:hypothetical protein